MGSIVFDFPTIRSLAENLASELDSSAGQAPAAGGADEWEEYEEYEDVEVPDDDDYYGDSAPPVKALASTAAAVEAAAAPAASVVAKPKGLDPQVAVEKVLNLVREVVAEDDDVASDSPFMEAGVDSLGSVQLVTTVSKAFSTSLAPSIVFDYPTARALADYLVEESLQ